MKANGTSDCDKVRNNRKIFAFQGIWGKDNIHKTYTNRSDFFAAFLLLIANKSPTEEITVMEGMLSLLFPFAQT